MTNQDAEPTPSGAGETVTQWFRPGVKPVRSGAYEIFTGNETRKFAWWSGFRWFMPHFTPEGAKGCAGFDTPLQKRAWRGVPYSHGQAAESSPPVPGV
jgi:hypothetical protein